MKQGLRIYIASFFDTRERLLPIYHALREAGHEVTSSWLLEAPTAAYQTSSEEYLLCCALRDRYDIRHSHLVIIDTLDSSPRGGREWEGGIASTEGLPFIVVGPFRNVFHRQALRQFANWDDCLAFLKKVAINSPGSESFQPRSGFFEPDLNLRGGKKLQYSIVKDKKHLKDK